MTTLSPANRQPWIDNLRIVCVLNLFVYHTAMVFNTFGDEFYIWGGGSDILSGYIVALFPWYMPLLFLLAGMSARYAQQKRSREAFVKERTTRLLLPMLAGILLLLPLQGYVTELWHNGYTGGFFEQYARFFTFSSAGNNGYHGGFTVGHLWFILFLYLITLSVTGIAILLKRRNLQLHPEKWGMPALLALGLLYPMVFILRFGSVSYGQSLLMFTLGYSVFYKEEVQQKLAKHAPWLLGSALAFTALLVTGYFVSSVRSGVVYESLVGIYTWLMLLGIMGIAKRCWNKPLPGTKYLASASFPLYILHQPLLMAAAYLVLSYIPAPLGVQALLCVLGGAAFTFGAYEALRRIPGVRVFFGIRPPKPPKVETPPIPAERL